MKFNRTVVLAALAIALVTVPEVAFAADYPGQVFLEKVSSILTGGLARTVGIIMIAATGYGMYKGHFEWTRGLWVLGGIVTILGSATLYDLAAAGVA